MKWNKRRKANAKHDSECLPAICRRSEGGGSSLKKEDKA